MRREEILQWFEELADQAEDLWQQQPHPEQENDDGFAEQVLGWVTSAESALDIAFPPTASVHKSWERRTSGSLRWAFPYLRAVFIAAHGMLKEGRLGSLVDSIRVESESELLEQADELVRENRLAAAAVIAGGALETHLHHLVGKNGLTITASHGSISAYNQAIATERKNGNEIYSKADHDQVESWGKHRNDAAHNPGAFKATKDQVKLMIEGIRQFIARVT